MHASKPIRSAAFLSLALLSLLVWLGLPAHAVTPTAEELAEAHRWADLKFNGAQRAEPAGPVMRVLTNCYGVQKNSRQGKPLKLSGVDYKREFSSVHAGLELTRGPWKTETE